MNLLIIYPTEVMLNHLVELSDERARHIRAVLRASVGQSLKIGLLNGPLGQGTVMSLTADKVVLQCRFENRVPARPLLDLLLAMPRPKVLKRLWAQFAALGVGRITLVNAEKVERYYFDSHAIDPALMEARLIEGLQQARCTQMPEVQIRPRFKPFIEDELDAGGYAQQRMVADPSARESLLAVLERFDVSERVLLAVGPEGGWTPYELDLLQGRGFQLVGLGERILRSDTACIGMIHTIHAVCRTG
jgi:16S rRNA (uracil1498-N3)-methyltransferase